jgi:hypothetical protein
MSDPISFSDDGMEGRRGRVMVFTDFEEEGMSNCR